MKRLVKFGMCVVLSTLAATEAVYADNVQPLSANVTWQTAVWQHIPLNIVLPVGKERIIRVPHSAKIGVPGSVSQYIIAQRFDGWFYLTAKASFSAVPVEIQDNETGQMILINLSASDDASDSAVNIIYPDKITKGKGDDGQNNVLKAQRENALSGSMAYKTLTQYAEQQLYAPTRLLSNSYGIQLVESYPDKNGNVPQNKWVYNLFLDQSVVGMPWAEWHGGNDYVTAVVIKNLLSIDISLAQNIVNLCGRNEGVWKAVTFFPYESGKIWQLAKSGSPHDSTVAFLVSAEPFSQAIQNCGG